MSAPSNRLTEVSQPESPAADAIELAEESVTASKPFVGQWRTLVSTTNWEKGRIISEWRASLEASGAAATEYSDEAWAQLVGGVTGQHVGRLRRVHQRFGGVSREYEGLYWSHFQAACEWDDAEMWLEGALQSGWSVSQMRAKRWETVGGPGDEQPGAAVSPAEESTADDAGDYDAGDYGDSEPASGGELAATTEEVRDPAGADDEPDADDPAAEDLAPTAAERRDAAPEPEPLRPFADLAELPDDLADAFEQFKLAILNHKLAGWADASRDDVLGALESLKQLALAPAE